MHEKIKNIKNNHILISLLTSAGIVFLLWGIFFAQYFLSDRVTLARNGDEARQTFPAFIEMGELISEGIIDGVDVTTVNGSNSVHMDGLEWNFPYRFFAYLGKFSSPLLMFILLYMFYTFVNLYFTQRLCYRYFKMSPALALLVAINNIMFLAVWFVSFFVIASLVFPLIYVVIRMLESNSKAFCALSSIFYVLAFTSGYVTLSCILALLVFLFSMLYAILYHINDKKRIVYRSFCSAIIGTAICMPYYLALLLGNDNSNVKSMTKLSLALDLSSSPSNAIQKWFLFSSNSEMSERTFWIGLIWGFLMVLFVLSKVTDKMKREEKIIFWTGILLNIAVFLIDLGYVLPLGKWFYMIPVFGGMHLRRRFFHLTLPLLFVSFGIAIQKLDKITKKKTMIWSVAVYFVFAFCVYFLDSVDRESLIVELVSTGVAIYIGQTNGFKSKKFLLVFSFIMLCYKANILYTTEEVVAPNEVIKSRSIAFDGDKQAVLDNFVDDLPEKRIYKYTAVEGDGSAIPLYIPSNYGWYHSQKNLLSNYLKYPLHGAAVSDEYRDAFGGAGWYNLFNVGYLHDTRADFAILTQEALNSNPDNYHLSDDMEYVYLNDTMFCAKLKKYIPRHYTGGKELVVDKKEALDNGYFYCPTLTNSDIKDFDTNNRNYFKITVDTETSTELQYCMFPNSNYSYYIDGEKYEPKFDYGLAYFSLSSGQHSVEIIYSDMKQIVVYWTFTIYYWLILIGSVICIVYYKIKKREYKK